MNLGRSGTTRNKSRSPAASPSPYLQSASPRFLPPSHYAAAAGPTHTPTLGLSNAQPPSSDNSHTRSRSAKYAPNPPAFEDTTGYPGSRNAPSPARDDKTTRRKSQLELLETNLLPSLRDTVGRMTQPSSNAGNTSPSTQSLRYAPSESAYPSVPSMDRHTPYTPQFSTPNQSLRHERIDYSTPVKSGTPPALPPPALKSALRLPGHATPSRPADGVSSPIAQSLRRAKGFAPSPKTPAQPRMDNIATPSIASSLKKKVRKKAKLPH